MKNLRKFTDFSEEEIKKIANEYASFDYSMNELAKKFNTRRYVISKIISYSITHNIVTNKVAIKIKQKACENSKIFINNSTKTLTYYKKLFKQRQDFLNNKYEQNEINNEINMLKSILYSFDDYFFDDENSPSYEQILDRLSELISNN